MDIFGYPFYACNENNDMEKQMYAQQQSLASSLAYHREPHCMPEPTGTPWNIQGLPWGISSPPSLVQFTAQTPPPKYSPVIHSKRKSLDVEPPIPSKLLITEDKMAAHLNGLHISSDFTSHAVGNQDAMDFGMDTPQTPLHEKLKGHKIVLAEEIRKLKDEPLLPPALIERLEKPCMQLIVWQPKENIIEKTIQEIDENENEKKEEIEEDIPVRRNGLLVPEFTGMDVEM